MAKQTNNTFGVEQSTEAFEKVFSGGKDRLASMTKTYEEMAAFNKQAVEAWVVAGKTATKGAEELNGKALAFAKAQMDNSLAAAKALAGVKTLQDLIELQQGFAKSALEAYLAEGAKFGELATKVTQDAFAPINAQVQAAVERMTKPIAA